MFYRYTRSGARIPIDLEGSYEGESLFLLGGSPKLKELPLDLLRQSGIVTLGMNNVPCVFKTTLWLSADKPHCFSPQIYASPEILKFNMISRRDVLIPGLGKKVRECANMLFFGATDKFTYRNFLEPHRDLVWWRSVFPMALQLAWRLGFRKVFLVGCGFSMTKKKGEQYAWSTGLTADQAQYSQNTYNRDVDRLRHLKPIFDRHGFEVVSSTPGSKAHGLLPYVPLEQAVERVLAGKPGQVDTAGLMHSSELRIPGRAEAYEEKVLVGAK